MQNHLYKYKNNFYKQAKTGQWMIGVYNTDWTWFNYKNQSVIENVIKFGEKELK